MLQNPKTILAAVTGFIFAITFAGCRGDSGDAQVSLLGTNIFTASGQNTVLEQGTSVFPALQSATIRAGAAIINSANPDELLNAITHKENYETVAVLAATDFSADNKHIFTYSHPGALSGQNSLTLDTETIQAMTSAGIVKDLGIIKPQSAWNNPLTEKITNQFPNAKFIFLSINENLQNPQSTAYALKSWLPQKSLVLAITDDDYSENPLIKEFQQNYAKEILGEEDTSRFKNLPAKNPVITEIFGRYISLEGAELFTATDANAAATSNVVSTFDVDTSAVGASPTSTIYIVAFGDVMLGRYVRTLMDANTADYPFEKMDQSYMRVNDLLLANLEGPITDKAIRTNTGMNFGFFPDTAPLLKKYHFDILSQANNHAFDKTTAAYEESMKLLRAQNIIPFGNAKEIAPESAAYLHMRGQKIAFLGVEDVNDPIDEDKTLETIKLAAQDGYKMIVFPHWGVEYSHTPNKRQKDLAYAWIDAGAYAIIGMHPHVIQSYETYNGHAIFYSLGNAVFDQYWSVPTQKGLSIALAINDDNLTIYFLPIKLPASQMQLMSEEEAQKQLEELVEWGENPEEESGFILSGKLIL